MKKTKAEKGITLIALIITIVVLLILAVVTIKAVQGDGIIGKAKEAQTEYEKGQLKEETKLSEYEQYIASLGERTLEEITIEKAQEEDMLERKQNTQTYDKYGNKIVVPAGFKILVDSTTDYTEETIDVTKGIVITDAVDGSGKSIGNEFVWIPVGDVYTTEDTEKTESNTKKIELKRYVFADGSTTYEEGKLEKGAIVNSLTQTEPGAQLKTSSSSYYYTEGLKDSTTSNAHAKDIVAFKTSAETNHGYYIGRYEAGDSSASEARTGTSSTSTPGTLVCKANQEVYNWITQSDASEKCKSMYTNKPYESDLINSYAWDTAIYFIQEFSEDPDYSRQNGLQDTLAKTGEATDGTNKDVRCNIYDMAGNCGEWSTEACSNSYYPCVARGGFWRILYPVARNDEYPANWSDDRYAFRPLLYV